MPRTCFVIMPFSETASCSKREWTRIYKNLFKKTIEESGLDYECRRSSATRGSIIRGIIEDLDESWVVLADLTDQNPNVFYELGIRHSLGPRTILVAQQRRDIPFDLRSYASHTYEWNTTKGRSAFKKKIKSLLEEIDQNPERPENPVSDFRNVTNQAQEEANEQPETKSGAESIVGPGTGKLDMKDFVKRLLGSKDK